MMTDEELEQLREKVDYEMFCKIWQEEYIERALREPLPRPLRISGYAKGDMNWHDNFDYAEFDYFDFECPCFDGHYRYDRADGWLYNVQMDRKGVRHIQFLQPATRQCTIPTQTMYYALNQMRNAKFIRNSAKSIDVKANLSNVVRASPQLI